MTNDKDERIGVYVCHCGTNIAGTVDVKEVVKFAANLDGVVVSRDYEFMCSDLGQKLIAKDIEKLDLNRVVVAACSPTLHEETFMRVMENAGLNRFEFLQANIRELCSWVTIDGLKATEKAKRLVKAAVNRVIEHDPIEIREIEVTPKALVVGGGIAGIEAALDIAGSGKEVYLIEKSPSIGGHMAKLDKTFPTLDCSSCILTPKMGEVLHSPKISLMTYTEVESVDGFPGNYKVRLRKNARYVDEEKCNGCGICQEKCPAKVPSEFNEGMSNRKAIYIPFPQAVPQVPVIDEGNCIYLATGKCRTCQLNCPRDAIDFEQKDEIVEIEVGNIIIATGYELFDPSELERYGYRKYDNVLTSLEAERMIDSSGPTGGKILLSDGGEPESVAIIHCVGSRDKNFHEYCSKVCCMYSMKLAHLIREKTGANIYEFYMDIRAGGKGYEEFYNRLQEEGVVFVRGKPGNIEIISEEDQLVVKSEDTLLGQRINVPVNMVILSPAMIPSTDSDKISNAFAISRDKDGFFMERHPKLAPVNTSSDGIFLAGACQGPKDIPESVAQGAASAEEAVKMIDAGVLRLEPYVSKIDEDICAGCKICISVCPFDAIEFDEEKGVSRVEETLCKGCGTCVSVCPSGAADQFGYRDKQIFAEVISNAGRLEERL